MTKKKTRPSRSSFPTSSTSTLLRAQGRLSSLKEGAASSYHMHPLPSSYLVTTNPSSSFILQEHQSASTTRMANQAVPHRILFVDAYDSFSENIATLLHRVLEAEVSLIRVDTKDYDHDRLEHYLNGFDAVVIGPGPGDPNNPSDIGIISSIWSIAEALTIPVLGICLGFQSLCLTFDAPVYRMPLPCHGHAKRIYHKHGDIFLDVGPVLATCYNSLGLRVDDLLEEVSRPVSNASASSFESSPPDDGTELERTTFDLAPLAWDEAGWLMAVRHRKLPFWGLQFHPESCKSSQSCQTILQTWWRTALTWNIQFRNMIACPDLLSAESTEGANQEILDKTLPSNSEKSLPNEVLSLGIAAGLPLSSVHEGIPGHLMRLTASSGSIVQNGSIRFTAHDEAADFCHQHSARWSAMLESTKKGRFSIYAIPSPSSFRLEVSSERMTTLSEGGNEDVFHTMDTDVYDELEKFMSSRRATGGKATLPFWGGFIGFFSYEMGLKTAFNSASSQPDDTPHVSLVWVERSLVIDHVDQRVHIQTIRDDDSEWLGDMIAQIARLELDNQGRDTNRLPMTHLGNKLHRSLSTQSQPPAYDRHTYDEFYDRKMLRNVLKNAKADLPNEEAYKANIDTCQAKLHAGDSYELCLTVEAQVSTRIGHSWLLYKNLKACNPVPFAAYLHLGRMTVLSSSPEQFLSWDREGTLDMIPMKGTVRKSSDMTYAKASAILASPKESAENLMIADLIRHDLYTALGSNADVEVAQLCEVIEHETVYQLVSHIRANPPPEMSELTPEQKHSKVIGRGYSALQHAVPPGSMTGAPKKRSCEILAELEKRPRGVYSGVLGYLDVGGGGSFSVCIRTAFSNDNDTKDGRQLWRIGAGGAITVLSDPDAEWDEMQTKMESVLRAFRPREQAH